jgi:hypothetical protein
VLDAHHRAVKKLETAKPIEWQRSHWHISTCAKDNSTVWNENEAVGDLFLRPATSLRRS